MSVNRSVITTAQLSRIWAGGAATANATAMTWLLVHVFIVGLPLGTVYDPSALQAGAALLAASLLLGTTGALLCFRELPLAGALDDQVVLSLCCQTLPPLVAVSYAGAL